MALLYPHYHVLALAAERPLDFPAAGAVQIAAAHHRGADDPTNG